LSSRSLMSVIRILESPELPPQREVFGFPIDT
jgi:hypothetical protein